MDKKTWEEFSEAGLLWWINMILHTFGWAIVVSKDIDGNVLGAFPARVKYRGFECESNDRGYFKVTNYLKNNVNELIKECEQPDLFEFKIKDSIKVKGRVINKELLKKKPKLKPYKGR